MPGERHRQQPIKRTEKVGKARHKAQPERPPAASSKAAEYNISPGPAQAAPATSQGAKPALKSSPATAAKA